MPGHKPIQGTYRVWQRLGGFELNDIRAIGTVDDGIRGQQGNVQRLKDDDAVLGEIGKRSHGKGAEPGTVLIVLLNGDVPEAAGAGDVIGQGILGRSRPKAEANGAGIVGAPPDDIVPLHGIIRLAELVLKVADKLVKELYFNVFAFATDLAVHNLSHHERVVVNHGAHDVPLDLCVAHVKHGREVRCYANVLALDNIGIVIGKGADVAKVVEVVRADSQAVADVVVINGLVSRKEYGICRQRQGVGVAQDNPGLLTVGVVDGAVQALGFYDAPFRYYANAGTIGLIEDGLEGVVVEAGGIGHGELVLGGGDHGFQADEALGASTPVHRKIPAEGAAGVVTAGLHFQETDLVGVEATGNAADVPGGGADAVVLGVVRNHGAGVCEGLGPLSLLSVSGLDEVAVQGAEAFVGVVDVEETEGEEGAPVHGHKPFQAGFCVFGDELIVINGRGILELRGEYLLAFRAEHAPDGGAFHTFFVRIDGGEDAAALFGKLYLIIYNRQDDFTGAIGYAVVFGFADFNLKLAQAVFVEFADVFVVGREDPLAFKVDEAVLAVHFYQGAAVIVKLLGVVEGGGDYPLLLLILVSVLFGLLVLGGLEVLCACDHANCHSRKAKKCFYVQFHEYKDSIFRDYYYFCRPILELINLLNVIIMKKLFRFAIAAVAMSALVISCTEDPKPDENKTEDKTQEEKVKPAVDGKFDEWTKIAGVEGEEDGAIIILKAQADDKNLYIYTEVDNDQIDYTLPFSNKMYVYMSNGAATTPIAYWADATYNVYFDPWMIADRALAMAQWTLDKFSFKGKAADGVLKLEFAIPRSFNEVLEERSIFLGVIINGQNCSYDEAGAEVWGGSEEPIGCAPAQGEEMYEVSLK